MTTKFLFSSLAGSSVATSRKVYSRSRKDYEKDQNVMSSLGGRLIAGPGSICLAMTLLWTTIYIPQPVHLCPVCTKS